MNVVATGAILALFAITVLSAMSHPVLADHPEVVVETAKGSVVPGCETTPEGCYIPSVVTVDAGSVIIFSNTDNVTHTFTSGTAAGGYDGTFDSALVPPGSSYEYKTSATGEIPYYCVVHPWMEGTIIVQGGSGGHHDEMHGSGDGSASHASAYGAPYVTPMSDGTLVSVSISSLIPGEPLQVNVEFLGTAHSNYDVIVTQNDVEVLRAEGLHVHEGPGVHSDMTDPLGSDDPVDVTIIFQGYGINDMEGPVGEVLEFVGLVSDPQAMMETEPSARGIMSDGTVVSVWLSEPMAGKPLDVTVGFDPGGHRNYDVIVTQNDIEVLRAEGLHVHEGLGVHSDPNAPLDSDDPVDVTIIFQGAGHDKSNLTGPIGEEVKFTNIVPEFGVVAVAMLAVAVIAAIMPRSGALGHLAPRP